MSYILDALKKNKPTDEQHDVPDLSSDHAYHELEEEKSFTRWFWPIVVIVLLLAIGVLTFMLFNPSAQEVSKQWVEEGSSSLVTQEQQNSSQPKMASTDPNNQQSDETLITNKPLDVAQPVVTKIKRSKNRVTVNSNSANTKKDSSAKSLTHADLPSLTYTTHIYATQPKDRFVMLNGKAYAEGDKISQNLRVKEILENDLVVIFKGQEFVIPSLEDVNLQ
ncbi:hypothetical protein DZA50_05550 [Kangiella sp. HD9-110m-PIT-SAG07]|nr:hypothetical protein DZA50_05550 [Kangiella sp. HD9-110m-PIT-SAG07]